MKFYIGAIFATALLAIAVWLASEYFKQEAPASSGRPDANDIRNLKIN